MRPPESHPEFKNPYCYAEYLAYLSGIKFPRFSYTLKIKKNHSLLHSDPTGGGLFACSFNFNLAILPSELHLARLTRAAFFNLAIFSALGFRICVLANVTSLIFRSLNGLSRLGPSGSRVFSKKSRKFWPSSLLN